MDDNPLVQLTKAFTRNPFQLRTLLPWIVFAILVGVTAGVLYNEKATSSKQKLSGGCVLSSWSDWKGCEDNNCTGIGVRTRSVIDASLACSTKERLLETITCAELLNCADSDCQYSEWSAWSDCPNTCFNNEVNCDTLPFQVRYRNVLRSALPGGQPCDWASLIERRQCYTQKPCEPDVDCTASAVPNPALECTECPDIGCTLSGTPYWSMCTRTIVTSASGNGIPCNRTQLLYSITCDNLPDCTDQCISYDLGAFSKCSKPCELGYFVSSTNMDCPNVSVGSCSNGSCSTGAFDVDSTVGSCSVQNATFVATSDLMSWSRAIADAVADPRYDVALSVSTGVWFGSSSTMSCFAGPDTVLRFFASSTNCVQPTWDMINAMCLYLCDPNSPENYFSIARGGAFPFSDGSVSCPIDLYMLSISQVCPIDQQAPVGRPFGQQHFDLDESDAKRGVTDPYTNLNFSVTCPHSRDCEYQSWSDAQPWSVCTLPCAQGGGTRSRARTVLRPETFIGNPCTPAELIEQAPCNLQTVVTSATGMWCTYPSITSLEYVSLYAAQLACSASRWPDPGASTSCNSIYARENSFSNDNTRPAEPFLLKMSSVFNSTTIQQVFLSLSNDPNTTVRFASAEDLEDGFLAGFHACQPGFIRNTDTAIGDAPSAIPELIARPYPACPSSYTFKFLDTFVYTFVAESDDGTDRFCTYSVIRPNGDLTVRSYTVVPDACPSNYAPLSNLTCSRSVAYTCSTGYVYDPSTLNCERAHVTGDRKYEYELGAAVQQGGLCVAPTTEILNRGVYFSNSIFGTDSNYIMAYGNKSYWLSKSAAELAASYTILGIVPFSTQRVNGSVFDLKSAFDPSTILPSISRMSDYSFDLYKHRADLVLLAGSCTSLSAAPNSVLDANLQDVPCDVARDCSLTSWVDLPGSTCSTCMPPYERLQTRSIVSRATEGGKPCDEFALLTQTACAVPECSGVPLSNVCVPAPFAMTQTVDAELACYSISVPPPMPEAWNEITIYTWALYASQNGYSDVLLSMTKNGLGGPLPANVGMMLNAQPLPLNGAPPLCLPNISSATGLDDGGTWLFSVSGTGAALGWFPEALGPGQCVPDQDVVDQLLARLDPVANPTISARVYDLADKTWKCSSACPYVIETCQFPLGDCQCGEFSKTVITRYRTFQDDNMSCALSQVPPFYAEIAYSNCPNPYEECATPEQCPIGCDGTPCNQGTGNGSCTYYPPAPPVFGYYACSCSNGSAAVDCGVNCPHGPNGIECSNRGVCLLNPINLAFECSCTTPGTSGAACQNSGVATLGLLENLLYFARSSVTLGGVNYMYTYTNPTPCEDENNVYCSRAVVNGDPALSTGVRHPFLDQHVPSLSSYGANMCINSGDGATWDPVLNISQDYWVNTSQMSLQLDAGVSYTCDEMAYYGSSTNQQGEAYNILAQFTDDHPAVPPWLQGKRFYTRCNNVYNVASYGSNAYTYSRQIQTDSDGTIFYLVGTTQSLDQCCSMTIDTVTGLPISAGKPGPPCTYSG